MKTINFSQTRNNLASTFDMVTENSIPVVVTRQNKEPVVLISLKDFRSLEETIYLMQSQANAQRLNRSIEELESGEGLEKELILE